jgi:hypothetical protein
MSKSVTWETVRECYRRAKEARRIIDATTITPAEKADFLEVERRWLSLARELISHLAPDTKSAA